MCKYFLIVDKELDNYLQSCGFKPINSNSKKSIYVKNEDIHMEIIGWGRDNNKHGRYDKGHYTLTDRDYEIEMIMWGE